LCSAAILVVSQFNAPVLARQDQLDSRLPQLVEQLSGDTFRERQEAMSLLIGAGSSAIEPLVGALDAGDPETRMRVMAVLSALAICDDEATRTEAQASMELLVNSAEGDIARLAKRSLEDLGRRLQQSSIDRLRKLGAQITGNTVSGDFAVATYLDLMIGPDWSGERKDLDSLRWMVDLTSVTLIGPQVDDSLIKSISTHPQLNNIVIKRGAITNDSIRSFAEMPSLAKLHLVYCEIDDECFDDLKGFLKRRDFQGLPDIWFYGTRFSREAADRFEQETGLRIDLRKGAFLGIYFNQGEGPCEITRVVTDSAAERGGFEVGDVVQNFAGREIKTGDDFRGAVADYGPGDEIQVIVSRGDQQVTLDILLGRFPDIER
jgi:hypothetical protein